MLIRSGDNRVLGNLILDHSKMSLERSNRHTESGSDIYFSFQRNPRCLCRIFENIAFALLQ